MALTISSSNAIGGFWARLSRIRFFDRDVAQADRAAALRETVAIAFGEELALRPGLSRPIARVNDQSMAFSQSRQRVAARQRAPARRGIKPRAIPRAPPPAHLFEIVERRGPSGRDMDDWTFAASLAPSRMRMGGGPRLTCGFPPWPRSSRTRASDRADMDGGRTDVSTGGRRSWIATEVDGGRVPRPSYRRGGRRRTRRRSPGVSIVTLERGGPGDVWRPGRSGCWTGGPSFGSTNRHLRGRDQNMWDG